MNAAMREGGEIIEVPAGAFLRRLARPDVRRAIHQGRAVVCTPFGPKAPFRVWNAMGRNKIIYALSRINVAVACEPGKGGTWSGATEALGAGFGRVAVWRGPGEGPGNKVLERRGAIPIRSPDQLEAVLDLTQRDAVSPSEPKDSQLGQMPLFGKTA